MLRERESERLSKKQREECSVSWCIVKNFINFQAGFMFMS